MKLRTLTAVALLAIFTLAGCAAQQAQVAPEPAAQPAVEPVKEKVEVKKTEEPKESAATLQEEKVPAGELAVISAPAQPEVTTSAADAAKGALEVIYFGFDRHDLSKEARDAISRNFTKIKPGTKIVLEGHTDEVGSDEYNLSLGDRRARSVQKYLSDLGLAEGSLRPLTYGLNRPADPGHTEEAHAKNRRVVFVIEK